MSYVITPVRMPDYYFCGPVWFLTIKESAVVYVSKKVAKMAAAIIQARMRKDFPKCRALTVRKISA